MSPNKSSQSNSFREVSHDELTYQDDLNNTEADITVEDDNSSHTSNDDDLSIKSNTHHFRIFNPGESPYTPEHLIQHRQPRIGEEIAYFDDKNQIWVNATVSANLSHHWKYYYNIIREDGVADGLFLKPNTRWTLKAYDQPPPEKIRCSTSRPQSLKQTPNSTPPDDGLNSPDSTTPPGPEDDTSYIATPRPSPSTDSPTNIDDDGTERLETNPTDATPQSHENYCLPVNLHEVANFNKFLPLQQTIFRRSGRQVPIDRVANLEYVLPLTSTPQSRSKRLLPRRRSLPLELVPKNRGLLPSFLHKFRPFRKKDS